MPETTIHQARTLSALMDMSRHISSSLDYKLIATRCLRSLSENLDLEKCALFMPTADKKGLQLHAGIDWEEADMKYARVSMSDSPVGKVFYSGMPLAAPRAEDVPNLHVPKNFEVSPHGIVGYIAVPVLVNRMSIGVLSAFRVSSQTMLDEDVNVMKIAASILSQTLKLDDFVKSANLKLRKENEQLQAVLEGHFHLKNLISRSPAMSSVLNMVQRVAETDASVLLRGESGTGKTVIAKGAHFASTHRRSAFINVNCAAIPENLIESELFGHEKGSFTGALNQRTGKFEAAHNGTIFLDEIGELSLDTQAKLLRIIQDGTFERLGSNKTIKVDVRLIFATNADLEALVSQKRFREDLYYRLMVIPIHIPPLRERKEDILPLVSYFLEQHNKKYNKNVCISLEGHRFLESYSWPGNVRELEHTIERAVVLTVDGKEPISDIPILNSLADSAPAPVSMNLGSPAPDNFQKPRAPYERVPLHKSNIIAALEESAGIQTLAAKKLGISLRQFRYAVNKHGIEVKSFKY
ncbi:MAG: sigma 54-interacting transcriptional regulator [Fibrobacteria bacterium]|nr:sigma 54-interacting transcriptional regulator [Fibrobacteria bacterium]